MEKVFKVDDGNGAPTLADVEARARAARGRRARHAGLRLGDVLAAGRPRGLAEGREPPAHRLVQDPRRGQQASRRSRTRSARPASSPRAPGTTARRSRGRRARPGSRRRIFMPRGHADGEGRGDAELRRARSSSAATAFDEALEAARRVRRRRRGATFVHPFEDERVIAGPGDDRARAGRAGARASETVVVPDRRRRARGGHRARARALRPAARIVGVQAAACAPLAGATEVGFTIAEGIAVKRPGELTAAILRDRLDDVVDRERRGDQPGDRAAARAREARRRGRGRGRASRRCCRPRRRDGAGRVRPLGREHRPDAADPVMRHGLTLAGRYLVVRTRVARPAGRADQAARR